jgi:hypothetical protein
MRVIRSVSSRLVTGSASPQFIANPPQTPAEANQAMRARRCCTTPEIPAKSWHC